LTEALQIRESFRICQWL